MNPKIEDFILWNKYQSDKEVSKYKENHLLKEEEKFNKILMIS